MSESTDIIYRPFTWSDAGNTLSLLNKCAVELNGAPDETLETMSGFWKNLGDDLSKVVTLAVTPEGKVVGYTEIYDLNQPYVKKYSYGCVDSSYRKQGIGTELVRRLVESARERVALAPEGSRVVLLQDVNQKDVESQRLFTELGWELNRHFYTMTVEFNGVKPPEPVLPEGMVIRSIQPGEEALALRAAHEAFKDHWGHVDRPFEQFYERYMEDIKSQNNYDPSLWFMAMDGDEVAGISLCAPNIVEVPDMGWVNTLGVRRPWRKRGVGLALLYHTFNEFFRRGSPHVGLGVDASSLTGATRLYERAGMKPVRVYCQYMLVLRDGVDLTTQQLED